MSGAVLAVTAAALLVQVSGTDLMVFALLAFACFGIPGIAVMLYFQHRSDD